MTSRKTAAKETRLVHVPPRPCCQRAELYRKLLMYNNKIYLKVYSIFFSTRHVTKVKSQGLTIHQ